MTNTHGANVIRSLIEDEKKGYYEEKERIQKKWKTYAKGQYTEEKAIDYLTVWYNNYADPPCFETISRTITAMITISPEIEGDCIRHLKKGYKNLLKPTLQRNLTEQLTETKLSKKWQKKKKTSSPVFGR